LNHGSHVHIRLTDYEVALRDHLKLRKNLDKQDYAAIGYRLRDRKRSGKESVVLLNGEQVRHKRLKRGLEHATGRRQLGMFVPLLTLVGS
jgi:hypothetical protein